eukprot:m51a1_g12017 hypothetical protein (376) ;mRNA; r:6054-7254
MGDDGAQRPDRVPRSDDASAAPGSCTGHADVLALGSHARLGLGSPVSLLPSSALRDLLSSIAETLVVLDADDYARRCWRPALLAHSAPAPQAPVYVRCSLAAPERWRWRTGPLSAAPAVRGSAAAPWGPGRVLVCGGTCGAGEEAPSRVYDAARGAWEQCAVPPLVAEGHTAVSHAGQYHALGCVGDSWKVLAEDGLRWEERSEGLPGPVEAACSLAGSLWALVDSSDMSGVRLGFARCDPRARGWESVAARGFQGAGTRGASVAACGDCVCTVGGFASGPHGDMAGARQCQRLDVRMPAWQQMAPLNEGRGSCGLASLEGRQCLVALAGLQSLGVERLSVELYSPAADRWFHVPQLPLTCESVQKTTVALPTAL